MLILFIVRKECLSLFNSYLKVLKNSFLTSAKRSLFSIKSKAVDARAAEALIH